MVDDEENARLWREACHVRWLSLVHSHLYLAILQQLHTPGHSAAFDVNFRHRRNDHFF
jgi:hypothetical protein